MVLFFSYPPLFATARCSHVPWPTPAPWLYCDEIIIDSCTQTAEALTQFETFITRKTVWSTWDGQPMGRLSGKLPIDCPEIIYTIYLSIYHYFKYCNNVLIKLFYSSLNQLMENVWIKWINVELWLELFYCAVFVVNNLKNVRLDTALQLKAWSVKVHGSGERGHRQTR